MSDVNDQNENTAPWQPEAPSELSESPQETESAKTNMTIEAAPKAHKPVSIIEKVHRFYELAELLAEPESETEIHDLLADIRSHGRWVWDYIQILDRNAEELKEKAKALSDAAKAQENRAKSYKEYLKTALKAGGFESFPIGDLTLQLSESVKYVASRSADEKDLIKNSEYVNTILKWRSEPDIMDWVDHKDKVARQLEFNVDKIKAEIKMHKKTLEAKRSTDEQRAAAQDEINKLSEMVREEYAYSIRAKVNKIEK